MIIQASTAIVASSTTDDVLVNNIMASNFRTAYFVDYGFTKAAAGTLVVDVKVGLNMVAPNVNPSAQARIPVWPDDFLGRFGVLPGDRILLAVRETAAAATTLFYCFRFTPAGRMR